MATTPNLNLELIQDDTFNWGQMYRDSLTAIDSAAAEHNLDGTHKTINTPNVVTPKITFPDGTLSSAQLAGGTAQTLAQAMALGKEADLGGVDFALTDNGRDLLRVDAKRGLAGMFGNIMNPLVNIPFKRQDDERALSGLQNFTRADTEDPLNPGYATAVTYTDPTDGLVKKAEVGQPRFERMADGGIGILLEGTSTNLVPNSTDLTTFYQRGTGSIATSTALSPDGTSTMFLASGLGAGGANDAYAVLGVLAASLRHEPSIWMQQAASTTGIIRLRMKTGAAAGGQWSIDVSKLSSTKPERITRNHPAVTIDVEFVGNGVTNDYFAISSDGVATDVYIWGAQLEALPFASSYIPTTGTALSRAADNLSIAASGNAVDLGQSITIMADADSLGKAPTTQLIATIGVPSVANGRDVRLQHGGTDYAQSRFGNGIIISSPLSASRFTEVHRFASIEDAGVSFKTFYDGAVVSSVVAPTYTGIVPTIIHIGSDSGVSPIYGHIRNFRIYDRALTDQEIGAA